MSVINILKSHNLEAFQEIDRMIESGITKIAAPRATGSGKTYLMGALAEKFNDENKIVLEPTKPLRDSIKDKFKEFGIENTDFMTYQKLIHMSDEDIAEMDYKVIFLDECHHGTAPVWGQKIGCLMATHSDSIVFGTSATVIRGDSVNVVETLFENNAIEELPLFTAIAKKILPVPTYVTAVYRLDDELEKLRKKVAASTNTKEEKQEFLEKIQYMKTHFEKSYGVPTILNKRIQEKSGRYLVFCKNKKHLDTMKDVVIGWFETAGIKNIHSYAVYSDYPDREKDYKEFCEDKSEAAKLMFSINILNEGIHIKNIDGVLMIRPTMSDIVYRQQLGRVLEAGNLGKHPLVLDLVNNFSSTGDGIGLLKEIKDAVAREKEGDPEFDDSDFMDIDTFFVLENVIEIQEMFKEIEGRLQGSWDLYIKALTQYKEREGDCLVPERHFEVLDGKKISLGNWCKNMRDTKKGRQRFVLSIEMQEQLNQLGFIWDISRYNFENNLNAVVEYYKENGEYPSAKSPNLENRKLGVFVQNNKKKYKKGQMASWKIKLIEEALPDLLDKKSRNERMFDEFIYYVKLFKERYGHVDIKQNDVIDSYKIGKKLGNIKIAFNNGRLPTYKRIKIEELGILLENKFHNMLNNKIALAKNALNEGVIITNQNKYYQNVNLYDWYLQHKNKLSIEDAKVMSRLIPKKRKMAVNIIDIENSQTNIYSSVKEAGKALHDEFHAVGSDKGGESAIRKHISGIARKPYKDRFMFYYATDEDAKKYFSDNKVS